MKMKKHLALLAPPGHLAVATNQNGTCEGCAFHNSKELTECVLNSFSEIRCTSELRPDSQDVIFVKAKRFTIKVSYSDSQGREFHQCFRNILGISSRKVAKQVTENLRMYRNVKVTGIWKEKE